MNHIKMEPPESTERRYNTRFRGVPRSVFTYSRVGRKTGLKSKFNDTVKTELRDDFIYTKLGKKPASHKPGAEPASRNGETRLSGRESLSKPEDDDILSDIRKINALSNGVYHEKGEVIDVESCEELLGAKEKPESDQEQHSMGNKTKSFHEEVTPTLRDFLEDEKPGRDFNIKTEAKDPFHKEVTPTLRQFLEEEKCESDHELEMKNNASVPFYNKDLNSTLTEYEEDKCELENELDMKKEAKSPFHKEITPSLTEFQITEITDSKTVWITSKEKLSFNGCNVASYNPKTKMFRCVVCQAVGFMSRIGEHYLGTHCNAKVFQCPQCAYCSAWWRCVRNHMSKNHGVSNAPASMWKNQPLLDQIMQLLQNLKYSVDYQDREVKVAENSDRRYVCAKCPYATDRRDLFNRHENIHREEKPFQCYVCYKLFNRADHVKKHFCRIHKDYDYDINLIRRLPSKRSKLPVTPLNGMMDSSLSSNHNKLPIGPINGMNGSPMHHRLDSHVLCNSVESSMMKPMAPPSHLLNCLTGSPTMVRFNNESLKTEKEHENFNECNSNKPRSNLLSFLMQNDFPPKPPLLEMPSMPRPAENYAGKCIREGALVSMGFSPVHSSNMPKEFICPYCPWQSTDMWALRMHTATHYTNACVLCNYRSTQESDLESHMWECHRKRPCSKCNFLADGIMVLDAHMKEMHSPKHPFTCRICSQFFEIRSDMEAHCIFLHNQVLRECKQDGCDFCSTDPDVLEQHRKEKHESNFLSLKFETESASTRTLCLYCGCNFADPKSLSLHEELFHENPLQVAGRRPLDPYCCAICGYATPQQLMMMEHLRIHTGQALYCYAGDGCYFQTPYDTVLREHVLQNHCNDEGIVRCPHCGLRCSTRYTFVSHYEENHHPFCCDLCEEVEHKHFVVTKSSYLDSTIAALFPFAKNISQPSSSAADQERSQSKKDSKSIRSIPKDALIVDTVRRSRKQLQPRKVVVGAQQTENTTTSGSVTSHCVKKSHRSTVNKLNSNNFISFYAKKVRSLAQVPLLRCRCCVKNPLYFRHKRNYVFHVLWHRLKKYRCDHCVQNFDHRYQVLLHNKREHTIQAS